jgi:predicted enzyme related to lactoylglutathione lyase
MKNGTFCWSEYGTTDVTEAKAFYGKLFGWTFQDFPMGPGEEVYTMQSLKGKRVGGFYAMPTGPGGRKPPIFWLPYILVQSVDRTVAHIKKAGGMLYKGPMDAGGMGRMAIFQDPTGAAFALWQPLQRSKGDAFFTGAPGAVCWHDLNTPDPKAAEKFYAKVFGWKQKNQDYGGNVYYMQTLNGKGIGGIWPHMAPGSKPGWVTHWEVKSCAQTVTKAKKLGARVVMGPIPVPGGPIFAILQDPQDAVLGLVEFRGKRLG